MLEPSLIFLIEKFALSELWQERWDLHRYLGLICCNLSILLLPDDIWRRSIALLPILQKHKAASFVVHQHHLVLRHSRGH